MKTIIPIIALSFTFSARAQSLKEAAVPAPVKESFVKKYPGATVKWEKEGADYEAEFDWNNVESSAVFDAAGTFKELEQEIKVSELPKEVPAYCAANFAGYKISEAEKITDASGKIMYEAEMKGKDHFDALFDEQGNFVRKSTEAK